MAKSMTENPGRGAEDRHEALNRELALQAPAPGGEAGADAGRKEESYEIGIIV